MQVRQSRVKLFAERQIEKLEQKINDWLGGEAQDFNITRQEISVAGASDTGEVIIAAIWYIGE